MVYEGAKLSRKQKTRVRSVWHAGISNQQRVDAAKNSILDYLAEKGYLRAELTSEVLLETMKSWCASSFDQARASEM